MNFWEWIYYVVSEVKSFEFFLPYGPMLTKMKKKIVKNQTCTILKKKKKKRKKEWSGDYGEEVPFHQTGINLFDGFWENGFYGRRTNNGRLHDDSSSAV